MLALKVFRALDSKNMLRGLSDATYLRILYRLKFGKPLDLLNPQTFNEKLQWLKINYRKPIFTSMVDKYEAKKIIEEKIGSKYVIPTLGVWDSVDDIDFDALPDQFVLKCTHNSGGLVVCRDKGKLDLKAAKERIKKSMKKEYFYHGREWPYKDVKPRIIAEPLIHNDDNSALVEYNFFCFSGEPKMVMYCHGDRDKGETRYNDFFLMDGTKLPLSWGYRSSDISEFKPFDAYSDMVEKAKVISSGLPFLRVDFYLANGKALMGEMTFFHWSGLMPTTPPEWDKRFGEWIKLPSSEKL